ncbi:MAG: alpha-L-rhamnosidase [Pirellulaceae bacterium]|nr:alpha-L-rhamnosidase [Pirellulaceae bacterium]
MWADSPLSVEELQSIEASLDVSERWRPHRADLSPAQWIWLPSQRTLPNTFVLFRREVKLDRAPLKATGFITADSRYRLTVNGRRVQWGPAPCDPRNLDVDPVDLTPFLSAGNNVIGVEVLFYGHGDGTWAAGKPGMIFHVCLEYEDGRRQRIVSDQSWQATVDRAHRPGQYKRWFLRSLQEEFDARLHPFGWDTPDFTADESWTTAMPLDCPSDKPPACGRYFNVDSLERVRPDRGALRLREIPPLCESEILVRRLTDAGRIEWLRDPDDWFEFRIPNSFHARREPLADEKSEGVWQLPATDGQREGVFATFEFSEQIVGWPGFTIDAPAGTIVELICQEAHDPAGPAWLDNQFFNWSRYICREGVNRFEAFDFESLRWMQLHVRNAGRPVTLSKVGVRRRAFDWPHPPHIRSDEPALQRLLDASINTLYNSAQETCVDGMARERQQYSGDGGHQLLAVRSAFGETRLAHRFLRTFSEGQTPDGFFLDCWPAYDRLARIMQRQIDGSVWGPLLDHGVGFNFDCWNHYLETGDMVALDEPYPRLLRFADYLHSIRDGAGLLPVEGLGVPAVWIDHSAYRQQRHKQCAFNLYTAAMLEHALAPIARSRGDQQRAEEYVRRGQDILAATVRRFWSTERGLFVDNLPWLAEEKKPRLSDRTLATAILFDQCPENNSTASLQALIECPAEMGLSYPCNACWRYWALARLGRADVAVQDFRRRWATMQSVVLNNTLQETWEVTPDSCSQWSHCAVAPLFVFYSDIAGVRATSPGFAACQIRPQLGDLGNLELTYHTVRGPLRFTAKRQTHGHEITIDIPAGCNAELLLPDGDEPPLRRLLPDHSLKLNRYQLQSGKKNVFQMRKHEG